MNKNQKPVLTGQRFKTRKRDEKEKFEPTVFRDTIVQGLNEAGSDLEAIAKFLDSAGSRLDYRRYADTLFDILVAGSMLAPGGTRIDDNDKTKMTRHCVFFAEEDHDAIRNYAQVFNKLIRRYKYLEKAFEDEIKKLLLFLKAFSETEQTKLAMLSGILLANGTLPATILTSLFTDNIVKEGIAASFAVKLFKAWMAEKDANSVTSALRKANLDKRLLELFPANRQNVDHFAKYFTEAGLKELSDFLRVQQSLGTRKELQKELQERLSQECPIKEMVLYVKEEMKRNELPEPAVIGLLWTCVMNAVEWNKKEELVAEQALKHLKLVSLLLIGIAAWGIGFGLISSFRVVGVAIAVGIFLFFIALVGLIGAVKHHQVLLFFYMIILLLVFIVQFSVSCACLALNKEQQSQLLEVGWNNTKSARTDLERNLNCCGFRFFDPNETCSSDCFRSHQCQPCAPIIEEYSGMVLRFVGGIGLFFSFTEILGVWLTYRYRNQKDPRANPSAFL